MCSNECQLSHLLFNYEEPRKFVEPECGSGRVKSGIYVIYRLFWVVYFVTILSYDAATYGYGAKWLIFLTNWSYLTLILSCMLQLIAAIMHFAGAYSAHREKDILRYKETPIFFKIVWIINNIAINAGVFVSLLYWIVLFDPKTYPVRIINVTTHGINSLYILSDMFITGMPMRILHFYLGMIYALVYILFTIIYWQAGGTNEQGFNYVYSALDYKNEPNRTTAYIVGIGFAIPLVHSALFGLFKLRVLLYSQCGCTRNEVVPI